MRVIQPSLAHCVWEEPMLICRGCSAAMRGDSECVCVSCCFRASIKCRSRRRPEFLPHQSDAYSENARRRSSSWAGGARQLGEGCQPGPWYHLCSETTQACSHTPAGYLPLELFTPGCVCISTSHNIPAPVSIASYCTENTPAPVNWL